MEAQALEEAIGQVERLYQTVTGREAPPSGEEPYAPIPPERKPEEHVQEQLDRLSNMLGQISGRPTWAARWAPALSMWENPSELVVCLDLPGVPRDAVRIQCTQGLLEVSGERTSRPSDGDVLHARYVEHPRGQFFRLVPIPFGTNLDEFRATLRDGILEIRVPRGNAAAGAKAIPVT